MSERRKLYDELCARVAHGLAAGLSVEQIQHQPRTQEILLTLHPPSEMIERGHRDVIRGVIQQMVNEKGERLWVYVENMRIPFDPEPAEEDAAPERTVERLFYPAARVADDKVLQRAALSKLHRLLRGSIRRAGSWVAPTACAELLTAMDEVFGRLIAGL